MKKKHPYDAWDESKGIKAFVSLCKKLVKKGWLKDGILTLPPNKKKE